MEGGVPGGEPGVFPLVGHGEDVAGEEVPPVGVAPVLAGGGRGGLVGVAVEPVIDDELEELFGPEQTGVTLAGDHEILVGAAFGEDVRVEGFALGDAGGHGLVEAVECGDAVVLGGGVEAGADGDGGAGGDFEGEVGGAFGAALLGVDGAFFFVDDVAVEGVFAVRGGVFGAKDALEVGLVVAEERFGGRLGVVGADVEEHVAELFVMEEDGAGFFVELHPGAELAFAVAAAPGPDVAEPDGGQDVEGCGFVPPVGDGELPEQVVGAALGDFLEDVEVGVAVEEAEVGELEFAEEFVAPAVFLDELGVGVAGVGVFVEAFGVGVGGGGVEVVVALFDVLTVAAPLPAEAEEALFEDVVLAVPKGGRHADAALAVGSSPEPVFAPAVGAAACLVVGEILPAFLVAGVVLPDGAPLALGEVGAPAFPIFLPDFVFCQSLFFRVHGRN